MDIPDWFSENAAWLVSLGVLAAYFLFKSGEENKRREKEKEELYENINEIVEWLTEIDPRFDEEKKLLRDLEEGSNIFAGKQDLELTRKKQESGERTLADPLRRSWRRKLAEERERYKQEEERLRRVMRGDKP